MSIIKFNLKFIPGPSPLMCEIHEMNAWRKILYLTRLIGQDASRYDGLGYGNISCLIHPLEAPEENRLVISGTQTGHIADLTAAHYVTVIEADLAYRRIVAKGLIHPSSESLTHAAVYASHPEVRCVIHAHSPEIWHHAFQWGLPITRKDSVFGTPDMVQEVQRLFECTDVKDKRIFAMRGHPDGIISFGKTVEDAAMLLLHYLAKALC